MSETRRLLDAASALSQVLQACGIPHAFYGSVFTAVIANASQSDEIFCIVEGGQGQTHPFRRVRDAVGGSNDFAITHSPWTNRLHVTWRRPIPAIEIEVLPAGETGPRRLNSSTVTLVQGIPFLTISEFVRAKLKTWMIRRSEKDAMDISYAMSKYWNKVDINRIPEQDMSFFVSRAPSIAPAWIALQRKYGGT
ncbi:hypothetical protein K435DRAFT_766782 [Dendrothele bispora CBS 962.96]|uniref:Uncharacterized protein n=1 Tax=Dendrothele bispora (strain CBS 962.96) TaxID=1314807 RepID=A0A4S8L1J9_DENBC|nr:hypothetical protein K435DRAFT_766782 [Dendrothele bispora CBS 962.96]